MTMNTSWGYKHYDHNWKSSQTLIRMLVDIASKGGNLLLNVGPTAVGEIPEPSVERLQAMGKWMAEGKLKTREDVYEGIENFPETYNRLFSGEKLGKLVLKVLED